MSTPLRIAVINHVHPMHQHVSALRMRKFAEELALYGDQVMILSASFDASDPGTDAITLPTLFADHDWSRPLHTSTLQKGDTLSAKAREGRLPSIVRQSVICWSYLSTGGVFTDWRKATAPLLPEIARAFAPDIVFATFGNTDTWAIARSLAKISRCPWIADMKDNWTAFVPAGLRGVTARRFDDMAHMTVYSGNHKLEADKWFCQEKTVIYSGYNNGTTPLMAKPPVNPNAIVLSGSLYDDNHLKLLCDGIRTYADDQQLDGRVSLLYAGNDAQRFERAASTIGNTCTAKYVGYLDPDALLALQASALANVYIVNPQSLFQQKLLELLAAARPIITLPNESAEAEQIAHSLGGTLYNCADASSVSNALRQCARQTEPVTPTGIETYSWAMQTKRLREIMLRVADQNR